MMSDSSAFIAAKSIMHSDPASALELFKLAVANDAQHLLAWHGLAITASKVGDASLARSAVEKAVEVGDDVVSHCLAADIALEQLDVPRCVQAITRCIALDPDATHPSGVRARALLFKVQDHLEARK